VSAIPPKKPFLGEFQGPKAAFALKSGPFLHRGVGGPLEFSRGFEFSVFSVVLKDGATPQKNAFALHPASRGRRTSGLPSPAGEGPGVRANAPFAPPVAAELTSLLSELVGKPRKRKIPIQCSCGTCGASFTGAVKLIVNESPEAVRVKPVEVRRSEARRFWICDFGLGCRDRCPPIVAVVRRPYGDRA